MANRRPPLKHGDVHPAHVLRDEYGMNAANRPTIVVDENEVPVALRPLIPYAERWAIPCDVTRRDYFDQQPAADIAAFWHDLQPHVAAVHQWLDSQPEDVTAWPQAAVHFLYLLKAHSEAYQPTEEEKQAFQRKQAAWAQRQSCKRAIERATEAFQRKDYAAMVEQLAPFEAELDKVLKARLEFARKKVGGP